MTTEETSSIKGYKNSDTLTLLVKYVLYMQILIALVSIISNYFEYKLLIDYQNGIYTSQEQAENDGEASDKRQQIIGIVYLIVFIISAVLILKWIYRANYNIRQLGAEFMKFSPGWSVGWYFVPIATLWKPYQAMKEIWKASKNPTKWGNEKVSFILPLWWFFWLISNFLGQAIGRLALRSESLDELIVLNRITLVSDIVDIPLAVVTLIMILNIHQFQKNIVNKDANKHVLSEEKSSA